MVLPRTFWLFLKGPVSNTVAAEKPDYHNNTVAVDALTGEEYFFDASSELPS